MQRRFDELLRASTNFRGSPICGVCKNRGNLNLLDVLVGRSSSLACQSSFHARPHVSRVTRRRTVVGRIGARNAAARRLFAPARYRQSVLERKHLAASGRGTVAPSIVESSAEPIGDGHRSIAPDVARVERNRVPVRRPCKPRRHRQDCDGQERQRSLQISLPAMARRRCLTCGHSSKVIE